MFCLIFVFRRYCTQLVKNADSFGLVNFKFKLRVVVVMAGTSKKHSYSNAFPAGGFVNLSGKK